MPSGIYERAGTRPDPNDLCCSGKGGSTIWRKTPVVGTEIVVQEVPEASQQAGKGDHRHC